MKIVFLDKETFPPNSQLPKLDIEHTLTEYPYTEAAQVADRIKDAEIIITNKVVLSANNMADATKLKMIALTATGSNNIDLDFCKTKGIVVSNIRNYGTRSVVEHVLSFIFALRRDLFAYNDLIREGAWQKNRQFVIFSRPISDLTNNVLAILGKGTLGNALAECASALGMKVIFAERPNSTDCRAGYVPFSDALQQCDILSLHCPLTPDNNRMMSAQEFAKMKKTALFINTARGALVDEQALAEALISGEIAGAGIDVLDGEPPAADNPLLQVTEQTNLIMTPHTAWISEQALELALQQTKENIEAFAAGSALRSLT